jgi:membrane protein
VKPLLARFQASKPWRAWKRYGDARGNILAAGVGYFAFFSIFPAVALAFTVFGFVLHGHPKLLLSVAESLNANLPGFVQDAQHPKGLIPIQAPQAGALTITGVIAFVTLVWAGMGWLGAVREGIRAVFGLQGSAGNLVTTKLRDLGVLFTLGLGIGVSAVLTTLVGAAASWIADRIGMSGQSWVLVLAGLAVSIAADTGLMMVLLRVLSGMPVPWRDLFPGAFGGGVGFSVLKLSASTLLPRLTANPLFASIAIVVGLLIWLNLIARLILLAAAWAANDVDAGHRGEVRGGAVGAEVTARSSVPETVETEGIPGPVAVRGGSLPTFGARSLDRTTLGAGVILGAAALAATGTLIRGIRSAVRFVKS